MLFLCMSNIFVKHAFMAKTRANSAKGHFRNEWASYNYPKIAEISWAKICALSTAIIGSVLHATLLRANYTTIAQAFLGRFLAQHRKFPSHPIIYAYD